MTVKAVFVLVTESKGSVTGTAYGASVEHIGSTVAGMHADWTRLDITDADTGATLLSCTPATAKWSYASASRGDAVSSLRGKRRAKGKHV